MDDLSQRTQDITNKYNDPRMRGVLLSEPIDPSEPLEPAVEVLPALPETDPNLPPDIPQELRNSMVETVRKDWPDIVAAQAELAKGVYVKEFVKDKNGQIQFGPDGRPESKVYLTKPDKDAGQYLMNQMIGKPKETTIVEGKVNFIMDL
jgi:hypothetical protein